MSLKSKIEAVIYASEEPVTLPQLVGLLAEEAEAELQALAALQTQLPLGVGETLANPAEEISEGVADAPSPVAETTDPAPTQTPIADEANERDGLQTDADGPAVAADEALPDARAARERERQVREHVRWTIDGLMRDYAESDRGIEIREVAGGFRMGTKPEYHDAVRGFVKSLKPALKLTLQALETLAVVAYKQPVTAAEISEIRGVDSAGVLGGLIGRKLIATAGRKQVIGRPMLYKTTKEFLVRFGLKDVQELPSMEEFERLAGELNEQEDLPMEPTAIIIERANARGDADHIREVTGEAAAAETPEDTAPSESTPDRDEAPAPETGQADEAEPHESSPHPTNE